MSGGESYFQLHYRGQCIDMAIFSISSRTHFFMDSTPATETVSVDGVIFTLILISNDNDIFVSSLSFIADMETNGQMITCWRGRQPRRDDHSTRKW